MARIRSIKPGFFSNEHLAELSPWHRLLFAGLWILADREGRLEDRPRRIKAALFPYDEVDVDDMLTGLAERGFVVRYVADGAAYLAIPTFLEHQRPKVDEAASVIPAPLLEHPRGISRPRALTEDIGHRTGDIGERECADGAPAADGAAFLKADEISALWNATTTAPIPRCRELTSKRRRHIKARLTEFSFEEWRQVFLRIEGSAFCRGANDRGWMATFDWVIGSPDVAVKVLEGKYDNRPGVKPTARGLTYPVQLTCPDVPPCPAGTTQHECRKRSLLEAGRKERSA